VRWLSSRLIISRKRPQRALGRTGLCAGALLAFTSLNARGAAIRTVVDAPTRPRVDYQTDSAKT
jgi:hypothetical protein